LLSSSQAPLQFDITTKWTLYATTLFLRLSLLSE